MEPLTAAAIASEVAAERALEAAALQTSEALASEAAREGLLAVEESLRTALRPAVERLAAGREQLARLPEGVGRYSAERHRLLPLENKLVGQSAEIYIERTYQGAGELTHPWEAPNGKRPDFMQTASESHRIDGVVDPSTGASDKVLVERGERVVHEVKTTQHPCATAEWARLSGQVEGTVQAMGEGQRGCRYRQVGTREGMSTRDVLPGNDHHESHDATQHHASFPEPVHAVHTEKLV